MYWTFVIAECPATSEWLDLITLIASVVGLYFVWKQIGQVRHQLSLQQFSDYTKRYQEIILAFPEQINESTFNISAHAKRDEIMRIMRAYADLCYEEWFLNRHFKLDANIWKAWNGGMDFAFSKKAFRDAWIQIVKDTRYGTEFEAFILQKTSK